MEMEKGSSGVSETFACVDWMWRRFHFPHVDNTFGCMSGLGKEGVKSWEKNVPRFGLMR